MRYPRIPHVPFSNVTDDDDIITNKNIFGKMWILTEKVDGSQISIEFIDDVMEVRNRNTELLKGGMDRQFSPLPAWIQRNYASLWKMLGNHIILFGEWLFHVHTIFYSCLPDVFIVFDLYNKEKDAFISFEQAMDTCSNYGLKTVPIIAKLVIKNEKHLLSFIGQSAFSDRQMEGIVLHSVDGQDRVKYVTPEFKKSVDDARHWRSCERMKQEIRNK